METPNNKIIVSLWFQDDEICEDNWAEVEFLSLTFDYKDGRREVFYSDKRLTELDNKYGAIVEDIILRPEGPEE